MPHHGKEQCSRPGGGGWTGMGNGEWGMTPERENGQKWGTGNATREGKWTEMGLFTLGMGKQLERREFSGAGVQEKGLKRFLCPGTRSCHGQALSLGTAPFQPLGCWEVPKPQPWLWELPHSSPMDAGNCPNPGVSAPNSPIVAATPHCQVFTSFLGSFLVEGETQAGFLPCPRCSSAFTP